MEIGIFQIAESGWNSDSGKTYWDSHDWNLIDEPFGVRLELEEEVQVVLHVYIDNQDHLDKIPTCTCIFRFRIKITPQ